MIQALVVVLFPRPEPGDSGGPAEVLEVTFAGWKGEPLVQILIGSAGLFQYLEADCRVSKKAPPSRPRSASPRPDRARRGHFFCCKFGRIPYFGACLLTRDPLRAEE